MQRRFSLTVLIATAVLAVCVGAASGAISGGVTAYLVADDQPASTPAVVSTRTSVATSATPTAASRATPSTSEQPATVPNGTVSIADIVERVSPAVVTVVNKQVIQGVFGSDEAQPAGTGTGFIIDGDGHIVTNNHVVEGSEEIQVIFADGTEANATLLGTDQFADLAVVKVDQQVPATVTFGRSEQLRPGDQVIAIGSALGDFTNTVTEGIVSALGRSLQTPEGFNMENMIQHDASINPGNSGGPLLNFGGEVVGVNTAVVRDAGIGITAEGLGFAIPSETVQKIVGEIIANGKVDRPYIGVSYEPLTPRTAQANDLPVENGVVVREVQPGSPGEQAGIEKDDVITKINGQVIDSEHPLVNELFNFTVGDTVDLELYRARTGETLTVKVTLASKT